MIGIFIANPVFSQEDSSTQEINPTENEDSVRGNWGLSFTYFSDHFINDFSQFSNVLGEHNTNLMNELTLTHNWGLAATYKKYQVGLNYGNGSVKNNEYDSLNLSFNSNVLRLDLGYKLIDRKRVIVMPVFSLKMNRYKLINSEKDEDVSIEEYLVNRDLDIRFNQLTGFIGLNAAIKINGRYLKIPIKYWTLGMYAGYHFKLNKYPFINSSGNNLKSEQQIKINSLNFGLKLTLYII
ncbi:hypothetical protein [Brumimicrobium glaciale]|uniref:hypothetical protein n=1 Tax=Brumimicrobium glaciale TaxID=200475 RepID=UPI00102124B3|nr:hypothetical protein [Brumimicrobium glaciale]